MPPWHRARTTFKISRKCCLYDHKAVIDFINLWMVCHENSADFPTKQQWKTIIWLTFKHRRKGKLRITGVKSEKSVLDHFIDLGFEYSNLLVYRK